MAQIDQQLYKELAAAQKKLALYTKIVNGYKAQIKDILGDDTTAKVGEEEVATYEYVNSYRTDDFRKQHPHMYEAFSYEKVERAVNWVLLAEARPELAIQYQTRKLLFK